MNNWPDNNNQQPTWSGPPGAQAPDTQPAPPSQPAPQWGQADSYGSAPTTAVAPPEPGATSYGMNFAPGQPPQSPPQSPPQAMPQQQWPQQQWPQQPMQYPGGAPGPVPPKGNRGVVVFAAVGAVVLIALMGAIGYLVTRDDGVKADGPTPTTEAAERSKPRSTKTPTTEPSTTEPPTTEVATTEPPTTEPTTTEPPATEPAETGTPSTGAPDSVPTDTNAPTASGELTPAQQGAADAAADFIKYIPSSRDKLIRIVTYDGEFTEEDAAIGIDSLNIDWNDQARLSAESYLEADIGFSHDGLLEQLASEYGGGFTDEQAAYGVDNVEADWNAQAVVAAKNLIEYGDNPTCEDLVGQLTEYHLFTPEQATYGATEAGGC